MPRFAQSPIEFVRRLTRSRWTASPGSGPRKSGSGIELLEQRVLFSAGQGPLMPRIDVAGSASHSHAPHSIVHKPVAPVSNHAPRVWHARPIAVPHLLGNALRASGSATPSGLTPNQIRGAYGLGAYGSSRITFGSIQGDGSGQTIALIDAYSDPNAISDLHNFDLQFALPDPPSFRVLNQNGSTDVSRVSTDPGGPNNPGGTWEEEESLDVQWAHVMAPRANLLLFEANSDGNDLYTAARTAAHTPGVVAVSMSFGGPESSADPIQNGTYFTTPAGHLGGAASIDGTRLTGGVTFLASTGDDGYFAPGTSDISASYPASSPNVVAVGGTHLRVSGSDPNYTYGSETGWGSGPGDGSGGGISAFETQPSYQSGVVTQSSTFRTVPDVSIDADPASGVPIYDSWDFGASTPWLLGSEGGTSLAAPLWAGLIAVADQGRAINGLGSLDGPSQTLPRLYQLAGSADFHDILSGNNGYHAGPGYDLVTGIGSPVVTRLIPDLVNPSGTLSGNNVYLRKEVAGNQVDVWIDSASPGAGTPTEVISPDAMSKLAINGDSGNDVLTLDYSNGDFTSAFSDGVSFNASSSGNNTIQFVGSASDDALSLAGNLITASGGLGTASIALSNVQNIQFNGGSGGSHTLNINAASSSPYSIDASTSAGTPDVSLNLASGTQVKFAASQRLASLNLAAGAVLDLNGQDLSTSDLEGGGTITNALLNSVTLTTSAGTFSGTLQDGAGRLALLEIGPGTLTLNDNGNYSGGTTVQGGALDIPSAAALPVGSTLTVGPGAVQLVQSASPFTIVLGVLNVLPGGTLDLTNNTLRIAYGQDLDPDAQIAGLVMSGRGGNTGIVSSTLRAKLAIGYIDNTAGQMVTVRATLLGDANLDGKVDFQDFNLLAANFGRIGTEWSTGDFNGDFVTDFSDFNLMVANFGQALQSLT